MMIRVINIPIKPLNKLLIFIPLVMLKSSLETISLTIGVLEYFKPKHPCPDINITGLPDIFT